MSNHGLTKENLLGSLPISLSGDPKMVALADGISELLARHREEIDRISIYPHIGQMDEPLLDILARDFKVDWWDSDYNLQEKRRTLASSWRVHKTLGTKAAVETALRAIYPQSEAELWFQYDGKPYHFRLKIDLTDEKYLEGKPERALRQIQYYKSLRDHLDSILYTIALPPASIHIGGSVGQYTSFGMPPGRDTYEYRHTLYTGAALSQAAVFPVPEDGSQHPPPTILRTGGVCTILSNLSKGE